MGYASKLKFSQKNTFWVFLQRRIYQKFTIVDEIGGKVSGRRYDLNKSTGALRSRNWACIAFGKSRIPYRLLSISPEPIAETGDNVPTYFIMPTQAGP